MGGHGKTMMLSKDDVLKVLMVSDGDKGTSDYKQSSVVDAI